MYIRCINVNSEESDEIIFAISKGVIGLDRLYLFTIKMQ